VGNKADFRQIVGREWAGWRKSATINSRGGDIEKPAGPDIKRLAAKRTKVARGLRYKRQKRALIPFGKRRSNNKSLQCRRVRNSGFAA
jgi:hypothetical protein